MKKLTEMQQKFAEGKAAGLGNRDAAIAAGYATNSADVTAAKLLARADIKAEVQRMKKVVAKSPKVGFGVPEPDADDDKGIPARFGSSLELMQHCYNNPKLPLGLRFEAAKQALPYEHGKVGEKGKKQTAKERADEISNGGQRGRTPLAPPGSNVVAMRKG